MHSLLNKTFLLNINMGGNKGKKQKKKNKKQGPTSRDKLHGLAS